MLNDIKWNENGVGDTVEDIEVVLKEGLLRDFKFH